jgi:hypothetical protein
MKALSRPRDCKPFDVKLAEFQAAIAHTLFRPLNRDETMCAESAAVAERFIKPNERLSSFARLQIYNQQYWWRLQGAIAEDFPGLRTVLGTRRFDKVVDAYLSSLGSTSWNLRDIGQHLEAFLRDHPALIDRHAELVLDMARVEWARVVAFDGPEESHLDPARFANAHPARLRIGLQPCLTLLELSHPIDRILGRLKRGQVRIRPDRLVRRPVYLAVHRQDFSVYYKRLEPEEFRLLSLLRQRASLETACAGAFESSAEMQERAGARIREWFATWMRLGWLCEA